MIKPRYYYLLNLLFVFTLPAFILAFFVWGRIPLINLVLFVGSITVLGVIWDILAVRHGKRDRTWLWQFNFKDTLGIKIFDLPIEEYVFYISSSLYIIFLWEGIKYSLETESILMYILIPFLGVWSLLLSIAVYRFGAKRNN